MLSIPPPRPARAPAKTSPQTSSGGVLVAIFALSANNRAEWAPQELRAPRLSRFWPPYHHHSD
eukprot:12078744-Alexandrium_andersonii.AAC.1